MKNHFLSCVLFTTLFLAFLTSSQGDELENLTASYEREKKRVLDPVDDKYEKALLVLKSKYTKAGRLEDALAVAKILNNLSGKEEPDFLRTADTKWNWASGGILTLLRNGKASHSRKWKSQGKWERKDDGIVELTGPDKNLYILIFGDKESATIVGPDGAKTSISLIKN